MVVLLVSLRHESTESGTVLFKQKSESVKALGIASDSESDASEELSWTARFSPTGADQGKDGDGCRSCRGSGHG